MRFSSLFALAAAAVSFASFGLAAPVPTATAVEVDVSVASPVASPVASAFVSSVDSPFASPVAFETGVMTAPDAATATATVSAAAIDVVDIENDRVKVDVSSALDEMNVAGPTPTAMPIATGPTSTLLSPYLVDILDSEAEAEADVSVLPLAPTATGSWHSLPTDVPAEAAPAGLVQSKQWTTAGPDSKPAWATATGVVTPRPQRPSGVPFGGAPNKNNNVGNGFGSGSQPGPHFPPHGRFGHHSGNADMNGSHVRWGLAHKGFGPQRLGGAGMGGGKGPQGFGGAGIGGGKGPQGFGMGHGHGNSGHGMGPGANMPSNGAPFPGFGPGANSSTNATGHMSAKPFGDFASTAPTMPTKELNAFQPASPAFPTETDAVSPSPTVDGFAFEGEATPNDTFMDDAVTTTANATAMSTEGSSPIVATDGTVAEDLALPEDLALLEDLALSEDLALPLDAQSDAVPIETGALDGASGPVSDELAADAAAGSDLAPPATVSLDSPVEAVSDVAATETETGSEDVASMPTATAAPSEVEDLALPGIEEVPEPSGLEANSRDAMTVEAIP